MIKYTTANLQRINNSLLNEELCIFIWQSLEMSFISILYQIGSHESKTFNWNRILGTREMIQ